MVENPDIFTLTVNNDRKIYSNYTIVKMKIKLQIRIHIVLFSINLDDITGAKLILGKTTKALNRK